MRMTLGEALRAWDYEVAEAASVAEALSLYESEEPEVTLLDIDLPDGSGLDVLADIKSKNNDAVVVMVTGNVDVENTVAALRNGAYDFIGKPVRLEELRVTLKNAFETRDLRRELKIARDDRDLSFEMIIGESDPMQKAKKLAAKVARSDVSAILLQGETGTGKDLFARAIHSASDRAKKPYLAINCAALPATLIESELFGYEKGAFTDAKSRKEGLFERADGGTIFLDEIGEMDLSLQAKLLRVLEDGVVRRIGGLKDISLDVRIITASNRDLKKRSEDGEFRLDLFYRISIIKIEIPPLRERGNDILLLAQHYIDLARRKSKDSNLRRLSKITERIFLDYEWKGNVRELRNVIERASILEEGEEITTAHLPFDLASSGGGFESGVVFTLPPEGISLEELQNDLARQAYQRAGKNMTHAAKLLDISRDQLRYRLNKSGKNEDEDPTQKK